MDISWLGHSCFRIKGKGAAIVTDPYDPEFIGMKKLKTSADIVTVSHHHKDHDAVQFVEGNPFVVDGAGEYEVKGVRIQGVQTFHDDKNGKDRGRNTMYVIEIDGIIICHCGDLGHELESSQLELLPDIDILMVPVGGKFTIDASTALKVISQIEPKVVIPMHYSIPGLAFELDTVEEFLVLNSKSKVEPIDKYSITKEKLPDQEEIVVLSL